MIIKQSTRTVIFACGLFAACAVSTASAQGIAALVNEEPVTKYDVAQRMRLLEATGQKTGRKEVLDDLIEEKIKFQEARKLRLTVDEAEVDKIFGSIAKRVKMSPSQLGEALSQLGANPKSLKTRIRADLVWRKVVQAKLRGQIRIREADVLSALQARSKSGKNVITEYHLSQIILVVPKGSGRSAASRRAEAANLRRRFVSCAKTLPTIRGLKDVVVKPLGRKRSDEMSADMKKMLESVRENELTRPNVTPGGIELVAVCEKRSVEDYKAGEQQIRKEIFGDQVQTEAKKLMSDLREKALVEIR